MAQSDRLTRFTSRGWRIALAIFCLLASQIAAESQTPAQPEPGRAQPQTAQKAETPPGQDRPLPIPDAGLLPQQQQAQPAVYDPDCRRPKDHDEADLCVQRQVAESAQDALRWTRWQTIIGGAGLLFVLLSLGFSAWASRAAAVAAREAVRGNEINRVAFVVNQRPWLSIEFMIQGDFAFSPTGGAGVSVAVRIKNIGKSPAHYIHTNIALRTPQSRSSSDEFIAFCEESRIKTREHTRSLLPGEEYVRPWHPGVDEVTPLGDVIFPDVFVCVSYESSLDEEVLQTAGIFGIGLRDEHGEYDGPIPVHASRVNADRLLATPGDARIT